MTKKLFNFNKDVRTIENAGNSLWMRGFMVLILTVLFSGMDGVSLFTVIDPVLKNNPVMTYILTIGIAVCLNFLPILIARFIHTYRYFKSNYAKTFIILAIITFVILYAVTVYLRFSSQNRIITDTNSTLHSSVSQINLQDNKANNGEVKGITLLLSISPLITSVINFLLAYLSDDVVKVKISALKSARANLVTKLNQLAWLEEDLSREIDLESYEIAKFYAGITEMTSLSKLSKIEARLRLAEKLGDANSISTITESADPVDHELCKISEGGLAL